MFETAVVVRGVAHHNPNCGHGTNTEAEWLALIHAAHIALSLGERDVIFLGDAAVVVSQANGGAKCRSDALRRHLDAFQRLKTGFDRIRIRHIGRSQNLAGIALDKQRR